MADQARSAPVTITEDGEVCKPIFRFLSRFVFSPTETIDTYIRHLEAAFPMSIFAGTYGARGAPYDTTSSG